MLAAELAGLMPSLSGRILQKIGGVRGPGGARAVRIRPACGAGIAEYEQTSAARDSMDRGLFEFTRRVIRIRNDPRAIAWLRIDGAVTTLPPASARLVYSRPWARRIA